MKRVSRGQPFKLHAMLADVHGLVLQAAIGAAGATGGIARALAQHSPENVEPPPSKRQHRLDMRFPFDPFAVVVGARGGAGL